jgi:aryl-alcohol dehydrogenase-like predicted oxidoreductase
LAGDKRRLIRPEEPPSLERLRTDRIDRYYQQNATNTQVAIAWLLSSQKPFIVPIPARATADT